MDTKTVFVFTILVVLTACFNQGVKNKVVLMQILGNGRSMNVSDPHKEVSIKDFHFSNCVKDTRYKAVEVTKLEFTPQRIQIPGYIKIEAEARVYEDLNSPLHAHYDILRRIGNIWYQLPCMNEPCDINDVCEEMAKYCPEDMEDIDDNCHCPIKQGTYRLPVTAITLEDIDNPVVSGQYRVKGTLQQKSIMLACVDIRFKLEMRNVNSEFPDFTQNSEEQSDKLK